jgi:hypothetical protein
MSEPLRTEPAPTGPSSDEERDALIERLLLAGLDQYFAGRHEQAINVWTRVAFLEGPNGRARAYIERARGALAESQRRSEELVHTGVAAYNAGDLQSARELLNRALDEGGANETALVFLQRLSRLEAAAKTPHEPVGRRLFTRARQPRSPRVERTNWFTTIVASVVVAAAILIAAQPIASWLTEEAASPAPARPRTEEPLAIVRSSETRLARGRQLFAEGRLHDALSVLQEIDIADPLRPEADRLRSDVQRELLATVPAP